MNYKKLLDEWQERLGLQDWAIALRVNCVPQQLRSEDAIGESEWVTELKCATVRIINGKFDTDGILDFDFEKTLVHELLHIKFSIITPNINSYETSILELTQHQLIDDLARALVMAKRGETKRQLGKNVKRIRDYEVE